MNKTYSINLGVTVKTRLNVKSIPIRLRNLNPTLKQILIYLSYSLQHN